MGASQSTSNYPSEIEAKRILMEKIQNMNLESAEDDYIHVDEKSAAYKNLSRARWTPLSASRVEKWEQELLSDPKNRYVIALLPRFV